jgi:hypothetical protein
LLEIHVFRHSRHRLGEGWEMDRRCGFCIGVCPYLSSAPVTPVIDPKSKERTIISLTGHER